MRGYNQKYFLWYKLISKIILEILPCYNTQVKCTKDMNIYCSKMQMISYQVHKIISNRVTNQSYCEILFHTYDSHNEN